MKNCLIILFLPVILTLKPTSSFCEVERHVVIFDFCGEAIQFEIDPSSFVDFNDQLSQQSISNFYDALNKTNYQPILNAILRYKKTHVTDDWLYYQLIRKTVQNISPKEKNYNRYTLYKWFLLTKSGYDAVLTTTGDCILFYVRCDENAYNIPTRISRGKQYVCLNFHDYRNMNFDSIRFSEVIIPIPQATKEFSYKIHRLPDFKPTDYKETDIRFNYYQQDFYFKVKLNPNIQTLFRNYPVLDYDFYLNIPLSKETYQSLIPALKRNLKGMDTRNGVDYLMRFTRYAFLFENDTQNFGGEKRLSPEQTLLYEQSDCEDRVALFFYLVKEIYNLPMIVLAYPKHVTVAVQFDKPVGKPVIFQGRSYSVCEPTRQKQDLLIGQSLPELNKVPFEVVYAYTPNKL